MTGPDDVATGAQRLALILRTLQISEEIWRATVAEAGRLLDAPSPGETLEGETARSLGALARAYQSRSTHRASPPARAPARACPACLAVELQPFIVRRRDASSSLVYGRCGACGHGTVLDDDDDRDDDEDESAREAAARARHSGASYYQARNAEGVGYDGYHEEAGYREAKGSRLVDRLRRLAGGAPPATLLEIGSGFGFTRVAAERAGIHTGGVDLNAEACAEARRRYGLRTFHGTLRQAWERSDSEISAKLWDAVLYQFVLEHVVDLDEELALAGKTLRPGGWLLLLVPSMEAAEIDVFGASYRSFRADHLHLFTRASIEALLARAGFSIELAETSCNIHLLRGFLSEAALARLYQGGRGPDLFVAARRAR